MMVARAATFSRPAGGHGPSVALEALLGPLERRAQAAVHCAFMPPNRGLVPRRLRIARRKAWRM